MVTIHPFRALRPPANLASQVASVPYDVVNRAEAKELARGNPLSFLHVTRPEIDMDDATDDHADSVYNAGAAAFRRFVSDGLLVQDARPYLYVYQLAMGKHTQTGLVLGASVSEYEQNIVRKHELTRPDKENDRVRHIEALGAQSGIVFLVHRDSAPVREQMQRTIERPPHTEIVAPDGIVHRTWVIEDKSSLQTVVDGFAAMPAVYIADGHHRSAAAARVAQARRKGAAIDHEAAYERFVAVSFPDNEVQILPYNRVVRDLAGQTQEAFIRALGAHFFVERTRTDTLRPKQLGMYLAGQWYTLTARQGSWDANDPIGNLDVTLLQQRVLAPLLKIEDPRRDQRIDFVGGIRGDAELEKRVRDGGAAVAFKMFPTTINDLFRIADAGAIMPPKSTWFEPKLRDGLFVHRL